MNKKYPALRFNQYGSPGRTDELVLFYARAKDLYAWAGIPRKGWQIRMLFQRPISPSREVELKQFWDRASNPKLGEEFILGPTAIIVAIQDNAVIADNQISLNYAAPVDLLDPPPMVLSSLAKLLLPKISLRLNTVQREELTHRERAPFSELPSVDNDYVYEFALQLQQMANDPQRFIDGNEIDGRSVDELIQAMEAVLRPAIVVDGQHRLVGAANITKDVYLPVVAIPHCPWTEQIYQFVVINEKAQRVDASLLTDIFGSSLTVEEQNAIRDKLSRSNVEVESRIAAVIANRTSGSPFENMVIVKMEGKKPESINPYVTERTIRALIDGSTQKHSLGWRSDEHFYEHYVRPVFPSREDWDTWTSGRWREYWFAFWSEVKRFYNETGMRERGVTLWSPTEQTNLTKAVTLRQLQTLFMKFCIDGIKRIDTSRTVLLEVLGDHELVDKKLDEQRRSKAIPEDIEDFKKFVRSEFLEKGIPVKVFTARWKQSLDDPQGQDDLWETLETAFSKSRKGESFYVRDRIFIASEQ